MIFEQTHGELFEVREIQRARVAFACAIQTIEAPERVQQNLPLMRVMLRDEAAV